MMIHVDVEDDSNVDDDAACNGDGDDDDGSDHIGVSLQVGALW